MYVCVSHEQMSIDSNDCTAAVVLLIAAVAAHYQGFLIIAMKPSVYIPYFF